MKNKINNINFSSIVFFLTQEMFLGVGLIHILSRSGQNAIYPCLLGSLIGILFVLLILSYFNYLPNYNLFEKINYTYKKIGKIINFILFLIFFLYFSYSIWLLVVYIQSKYLTDTPKILIAILYLIPVVYLTDSGIKPISKASFIYFIISILQYALMITGIIQFIQIDNLKPFIDKSFTNIFTSSIYYICYLTFPLVFLLATPKNNLENPNKINKQIFFFYFLCNFFIFILFFTLISVFGIDLALLFDFPGFSLLKKINFFDFISHIENFVSSVWFLGMFFNSVLSLYSIKIYTKNKFYYGLIVIALVLSLIIFKNSNLTFIFLRKYFIYLFIFIMIVLLKRNKN